MPRGVRMVAVSGGLWAPGSDTVLVLDDLNERWKEVPAVHCEECKRIGTESPCSECAKPEPGPHHHICSHCRVQFTSNRISDRACSLACADRRRRLMDGNIKSIAHGTHGWPDEPTFRHTEQKHEEGDLHTEP